MKYFYGFILECVINDIFIDTLICKRDDDDTGKKFAPSILNDRFDVKKRGENL